MKYGFTSTEKSMFEVRMMCQISASSWPLLLVVLLGFPIFARSEGGPPELRDTLRVTECLMADSCSSPRPPGTVIDMVVLHFSSNVVARRTDPFNVDEILAMYHRHCLSAHYLIDRDGRLYRLVEEGRAAFHAGRGSLPLDSSRDNRLNDTSIGIELLAVGSGSDMRLFLSPGEYAQVPKHCIGFTEPQYTSLRLLLNDIRMRNPQVRLDRRHVIGHSEYAPDRRTDPGELFRWDKLELSE
jgi:N-acetyl-anhydromuramyl-L-alanine amidase AmpD